MNVLIYSGVGTSAVSVKCTLNSISAILSPFFDIKCVDSEYLNNEPWEKYCRCIVIPGGADIPYISHLESATLQRIRKWVADGGIYIGICAGAYFASGSIEFEKDRPEYKVCGNRELVLFGGSALGAVFPNFEYNSEKGSHAALLVDENAHDFIAYFNGGCSFKYNEEGSNYVTLARYKEADMLPAIVHGFLGKGKILLTGAHIEYAEEDPELKECLTAKVLEGMKNGGATHLFAHYLQKLFDMPTTFTHVPTLSTEWYYFNIGGNEIDDRITLKVPELSVTMIKSQVHGCPHLRNFNIELFAHTLSLHQSSGALGSCILYAETVTSTQDILVKCDRLSSILQHGTIFIAINQTKGKGRGSNKWISAPGCLQFTLIFDAENAFYSLPLFQYIVSISIVQAICMNRNPSIVDPKIKWPNDIYCKGMKVGGILINSESINKKTRLYIGVGLNIDHVPFAGSINQAMNEVGKYPPISKEEFLAKFCASLDKLSGDWQRTGNFPFDTYYGMWMHSNQKIWIESEQAEYTITGIDHEGFLIASRNNVHTKLHPNMNSLDPLHGLVTKK